MPLMTDSAEARRPPPWLLAFGGLAGLTLLMFGPVLFTSQDIVLSNQDRGDLFSQYVHWRQFGFNQLRHGNLALWNPHIYSGAPFFGLQSGLLYPLNLVFLILPLAKAINVSIALHIFLAGAFTYLWAARRGLHPAACFLSGVLFMFGAPLFLQVYAGHLPHLCAMTWPPLLFLAIDGVFEKPRLRWVLLGTFAVAMQVLGGHPQLVFYTAAAAAVYSAACLATAKRRGRCVLALLGICIGGAALGAVQILSGIHDLRQTWRGLGVSQEWAATFSFPPANLLTLLAPSFFGDKGDVAYWGRWEMWEMVFFVGITGLVLALLGAVWGEPRARRFSSLMTVVLLVLALGGYSPLFPALYHWVPGFGSLRGNSKFIMLAGLFLALLAGIGFNALIRGRRLPMRATLGIGLGGILLVPFAVLLRSEGFVLPAASWWHKAVFASLRSRIHQASVNADVDPQYLLRTGFHASNGLLLAAATLMLISLLFFLHRRQRKVVWLIFGLALLEVTVFAHRFLDTFPLSRTIDLELRAFLRQHPGDYRIFNSSGPNASMSLPAQDVWGYDPGIPLRYTELLEFARAMDPAVWARLRLSHSERLLSMFRLRYAFDRREGQPYILEGRNDLPHLLLLRRYRVLKEPHEMLSALTNAAFNPREEVLLEATPDPPPVPAGPDGTARIVDSSTDYLTVEAHVNSPSILLVTDNYLDGWRARALPGSVQADYRVMPGDYCLRAIPLAAGYHFFRLEYHPRAFEWGKWISLASLLLFLTLVGTWRKQKDSAEASSRCHRSV
jgi:hypothetical protein